MIETRGSGVGTPQPSHAVRPLAETDLDDDVAWALVDAAPDGIVLADESGRILVVNRQLEAMFQYDRGELLGHSVDDLLPERFRQVHRAPHPIPGRAQHQAYGRGGRAVRSPAGRFGAPARDQPEPLQAGPGMMVVAVVRDISERVAAEAEAKRVHELLDATRDGVFIFDGETLRFTYVNLGAAEQVGYDREELMSMTPLHIAPQFNEAELPRPARTAGRRGDAVDAVRHGAPAS